MLFVTGGTSVQTPQQNPVSPEDLYLDVAVWYLKKIAGSIPWAVLTPTGLFFQGEKKGGSTKILHDDPEQKADLASFVAKQLKENQVDAVRFFAVGDEIINSASAINFAEVMTKAAVKANIPLTSEDLPSRDEMLKRLGVSDFPKTFHQQKEAHMYLLRAQDEKGLWQLVRKSSFLPDLQIKARMLVQKFPNQKVEIVEEPKDARLSF